MPNREVYEVDVPIHDTTNPALRGLHVFTGEADSPTTALRRAHEVYDAALAAHTAGLEIPGKQPDSWGARASARLADGVARREGRPLEEPP
jgi:hypothetical protein